MRRGLSDEEGDAQINAVRRIRDRYIGNIQKRYGQRLGLNPTQYETPQSQNVYMRGAAGSAK